jgi:hypothetical protein
MVPGEVHSGLLRRVGLFMKHGLDEWAEITLKHLIKLRCEISRYWS